MFFVIFFDKQEAMRIQIVTLLIVFVSLTSCRHHHTQASTPLLEVEVTEVRTELIPRRMQFIGYLQSNFDAVIQPRVNGFLTSKRFDGGKPVKRGQLLYTIDPSQLSTTLYAAEAALQSARAQAIENSNNYERAVPLAAMNAISQAQLDQYTAQYRASEASVRSAEQTLRNAQLNVGYTKIYSPIDGIAGSSQGHIGDYVGPGTEFTVLTTISNIDTLSFDLAIPMADYLRITGDRKRIYDNDSLLSSISLLLDDGNRYPLAGFYSHTRKDISTETGTLILVVKFANPDQSLKAGQFARVEALVGKSEPHLVVPIRAVSQAQGVSSVWVITPDSTAHYRRVETGNISDSLWVIKTGVKPHERVVITGQQKLREGMHVIPKNI